jgi:hypothetical protein
MPYDNMNRGAPFKNDRKNHDNDQAPDYRGELDVGGQAHWINAWLKTSKAGRKFMALSVKPKDVHKKPTTTVAEDMDDEIPF